MLFSWQHKLFIDKLNDRRRGLARLMAANLHEINESLRRLFPLLSLILIKMWFSSGV